MALTKFNVKKSLRLMYYMEEREKIRRAKEAGEPYPWTLDKVLRRYRFTNVKRENDRTTRELVAHYRRNFDSDHWAVFLFNCGIARYFGTTSFVLRLGWQTEYDAAAMRRTARAMFKEGLKVFTGAYMVTNCGRVGAKYDVVAGFLKGLWEHSEDIVTAIKDDKSWEAGYNVLVKLSGFGGNGFMAKEVLQDFLLLYNGRVNDRDTWTPVGPGARRGLNRLAGRLLKAAQPEERWIAEVQQVYESLREWWAHKYPRSGALTAHDVQFCLCEFDKYERALSGQGRPRSLYKLKGQ